MGGEEVAPPEVSLAVSSPYDDVVESAPAIGRVPAKSSPLPLAIATLLFAGGVAVTILGVTQFEAFEPKGWVLPLTGYLLAGFGVPLMFGWDKIRQQALIQNPDAFFSRKFERTLFGILVVSILVSAWNLWWLADFLATVVTEIVRGG